VRARVPSAALAASRSRAGFTLAEIVVAAFVLVVGLLALVGSSRVATASARRATLELRNAELIQQHVERLRTLPITALASGSATSAAGDASWVVRDSVSYLRVDLVVRSRPEAGAALVDTLTLYRAR
jgi:Tfp pilus assembly protein PilV